jgi:formiminotetrahydrofolate cyclodeaminase
MPADPDRRPLGEFLDLLAARRPAPGAGATAAIEAALAASLVAMVGRFTPDGGDVVDGIVAGADAERDACLAAAAADEAAFSRVAEAMKLPRDGEEEQETRRRALAESQCDAARPPQAVIRSAGSLITLAERLLPVANRNLVSDVAAAAAAARAAATTARLAVEVNLPGIDDEAARTDLAETVATVDDLTRRADALEVAVRARLP